MEPDRTELSPASALVLLNPDKASAAEAVKVTLMSLLAQGLLRVDETVEKQFVGSKVTTRLRLATRPMPTSPAHVASLIQIVRAVESEGGTMQDVVARTRRAYGANLSAFKERYIMPELIARGLAEERTTKSLGLFKSRTRVLTPAGEAERRRIEARLVEANRIPGLLRDDPAQAAALALALGGTILLVDELKPHYKQLSEAMRTAPPMQATMDGASPSSGPGHEEKFDDITKAFDFGTLDAGTFQALETGTAAFDSGFAGVGGGGGGDGGGGGGGN